MNLCVEYSLKVSVGVPIGVLMTPSLFSLNATGDRHLDLDSSISF